mmetsp:Transcript_38098/g.106020  ORF Transcript_38098/g.106020 Transcript_38098/m.106020 type:complete len:213 (+) Transcript_38098:117-755(+)
MMSGRSLPPSDKKRVIILLQRIHLGVVRHAHDCLQATHGGVLGALLGNLGWAGGVVLLMALHAVHLKAVRLWAADGEVLGAILGNLGNGVGVALLAVLRAVYLVTVGRVRDRLWAAHCKLGSLGVGVGVGALAVLRAGHQLGDVRQGERGRPALYVASAEEAAAEEAAVAAVPPLALAQRLPPPCQPPLACLARQLEVRNFRAEELGEASPP